MFWEDNKVCCSLNGLPQVGPTTKIFNIWPANKSKRVTWCLAQLNWTEEEWGRILWTNESSFSTAGFGHRPWVIQSAAEEYHPDCVDETFEQECQSKMAWGGFCSQLKSHLVFIPGKAKLDLAMYVEAIMEPHLVSFWHKCCKEYKWAKVLEDGVVPGHKKHAISYQELNGMDVIDWPVQSLDFSLIEALWVDMETELGETWGWVGNIETLQDVLRVVWENIPKERLSSLVRSMPAQLQAVIDAKGGTTPH